jgi:glycosyltransferase involved in cell wall biosynthesis
VELPYHYPALSRHERVLDKLIAEERAVLGGSHHLITPSRTGARYLRRLGVPPRDVSVVPNAVDTSLFAPASEPPPEAPPFRIVYEGTLSPWQGLAALLEALALLRGRIPAELHVVGPTRSTWRAAIRRLARRLRIHHLVHLSGPMAQADLVPVLRTAHVCVAPLPADPRNELQGCCPIKLLEYMAVGRPILSTRIAPVLEILQHEETAHLVRPGSATALADGLLWMAEHPVERELLGTRARAAALASWTPERFRERLAVALDRATGAGLREAGRMV